MKLKTYDEWRELGYQVKRGEKAVQRDPKRGPLFARGQVEERGDFDRPDPGHR